MQGTMELTSQENKGTCVTLHFPLRQPGETPQPLLAGERYGGRS
jgi:hypothetical protein